LILVPSTIPTHTYSPGHDYFFLNTVAANKQRYTTKHKIEGADTKARALYQKVGRSSEKEYTHSILVQNNLIHNCPITAEDDASKHSGFMVPSNVAALKGKTVKKQNNGIPDYQAIKILAPIIAQYRNVRLFINMHFLGQR
jgi:hypothetical protein